MLASKEVNDAVVAFLQASGQTFRGMAATVRGTPFPRTELEIETSPIIEITPISQTSTRATRGSWQRIYVSRIIPRFKPGLITPTIRVEIEWEFIAWADMIQRDMETFSTTIGTRGIVCFGVEDREAVSRTYYEENAGQLLSVIDAQIAVHE